MSAELDANLFGCFEHQSTISSHNGCINDCCWSLYILKMLANELLL